MHRMLSLEIASILPSQLAWAPHFSFLRAVLHHFQGSRIWYDDLFVLVTTSLTRVVEGD